MPDELDALLGKVGDLALRANLRAEIDRVRAKQSFGLVFESHLPERVRLPDHPVRRGVTVVRRDNDEEALLVRRVRDGIATLIGPDNSSEEVDVSDLVVVAEFGQPIYPGLARLGSVERGGDKPAHIVINAENHHALEALQFTHAAKVDCIYIDPPYNTGARDWKYDNSYVDAEDGYRHSKWLAFMERRLQLAKRLLNPNGSVLIVTIDEKEYLRLGLLLEQLFGGSVIQMVTSVVKPEGTGRVNEFSRTNEFIFFVMMGAITLTATADNMFDSKHKPRAQPVEWRNLRRRERESVRGSRPRQFYAVFVDKQTGRIVGVGDELNDGVPRATVVPLDGTRAVFPLTPDGREMIWSLIPRRLRDLVDRGFARATDVTIQFLNTGTIRAIDVGEAVITGRDSQGAVIAEYPAGKRIMPKTVWCRDSHNAQASGTLLLRKLLPGRHFPFPKSLYAVEDTLRFYMGEKRDAVVLDFFSGSGTTTHAVMRLNRQDGGRRQSVSITNNEVSASEAKRLRASGYQPGDPAWEELGIFDQITRPRITAAVTGMTPDGEPIQGDYKVVDEFAISDGLQETVEFFRLTYVDPVDIELDRAFAAVAPLLWMRAGGVGPLIEERVDAAGRRRPHAFSDHYGVLFDPDMWRTFVDLLPSSARTAFVVTDSSSTFAGVAEVLPGRVEVVRLYENYLATFAMNRGH